MQAPPGRRERISPVDNHTVPHDMVPAPRAMALNSYSHAEERVVFSRAKTMHQISPIRSNHIPPSLPKFQTKIVIHIIHEKAFIVKALFLKNIAADEAA